MGCTQSVKIIPQYLDTNANNSEEHIQNIYNTNDLQYTHAISADMIQQAYKTGYDDAMSIFNVNKSYSYFPDSQGYYNDGYLAGISSFNAENIFGFDKLSMQEFYDNNYGHKVMNHLCEYTYNL